MTSSGVVRQLLVAVAIALLVAGMYAGGKVLGRQTEPGSPPGTAAPSPPSLPAPRAAPEPPAPPRGERLAPPVVTLPTATPSYRPEVGPFGALRTVGAPYTALTFDDGPDPQWTPQVLEVLRYYGVRATFCVLGRNAEAYPELIQRIAADGHTLCNHSWDHALDLGQRSSAAIEADLARTNAAIRAAVPHAEIAYYRQPGGMWTSSVVEAAAELGMTSLHWTVDPQDWRQPGVAEIREVVRANAFPGAIVLLHDGGGDRSGTVLALDEILHDLTSQMGFDALPVTPPLL